jgi:hypothetical protein
MSDVTNIITGLRHRYASLNERHFEAGWTESFCHRRCMHEHNTLIEAAQCGMPQGAGWYVFAVENGEARELTAQEDELVNHLRFGKGAMGASG